MHETHENHFVYFVVFYRLYRQYGSTKIAANMAETSGKKQAQERVDRIHAFRRELEQLVRDGILALPDEQRQRLDTHLEKTLAELAGEFDVDISESQRQISIAMRIASALGGFALCAAVFLFFYRYWGLLSTPFQVGILILTPLLLLVAIDRVSRKERTLYYTSLLVLVALGAFIMNLGVLGSIFNIAPSYGAFLPWGALALILAYAYRLRLPLAGGLVALVIYVAAGMMSLCGGYWGAVVERPETFLPGGLALIAVPLLMRHDRQAEFPAIYRLMGLLFVFLALLMLANEGQLSFLPLARKTAAGIYQVAGLAASVLAIWTGVRKRRMESVNLGSLFFAVFLFNRLWVWWWNWMPQYLFFLIIGIIALVLLAVFRRLRTGTGRTEAS
jgi:uncharacterized membrane protein